MMKRVNEKRIMITGGAGFIGSAMVRHIIANTKYKVINVDKLTYASSLDSLLSVQCNERYHFEEVDICDALQIERILNTHRPDIVMHLAAESHVDKSIYSPKEFIRTNIYGTYNLLEKVREYWSNLDQSKSKSFRFHHVSTDEVFGDLGNTDSLFTESTPYAPSSPYSASKAGADHLVRAWQRTFGLPTVITNCSNNYGPYQFPEKLIPLTILNAIKGKNLPIYGSGEQVRDWLFVDDHAKALLEVALRGEVGSTYNIGGHNQLRNIDVVRTVCGVLDNLRPSKLPGIDNYRQLITHVEDRAGHDVRYAVDAGKIKSELNWVPIETFETGIRKTVEWYIHNFTWCENILNGNSESTKKKVNRQ